MAVLATAALVLGPGRERPAVGARVWGVPAEGARALALRLETMERQFGSDQAVSVEPIEVTLLQAGKPLATWTGRSGEDGVAEALLQSAQPLAGSVDVRVARGKALLADGPVALRHVDPPAREHAIVEGKNEGLIRLRVEIERGLLAAPFPGTLRVVATGPDGAPMRRVEITPALEGADEGPRPEGGRLRTDESGAVSIPILPTSHAIELRLSPMPIDDVGDKWKGSWEGGLPVHPGALWLAPAAGANGANGSAANGANGGAATGTNGGAATGTNGGATGTFEVVSPVPRDRAYASVLTPEGRALGAIVTLSPDNKGFSRGTLTLPPDVRDRAVGVTLAGDPQERGSGTVTWPTSGTLSVERAPHIELVQDGLPLAERLEKARARTARLVSVAVAVVAALFEAVLLVLYSRESQEKLAAHLAEASEDAEERAAAARMTAAPASRAFTLVVTVGLVVLGFGAVAAFAAFR
jgi:hypothetical protein